MVGERGRIGDPASVRSDHRRTVMVAVTQHFHDGIVRKHTNTHYKRRDPNFQCFPKDMVAKIFLSEVWAHCKSMEGLPKAGQMLINM